MLQGTPKAHKQIQELRQDCMAQVRMPKIHLHNFQQNTHKETTTAIPELKCHALKQATYKYVAHII
jgi:hypothetical protein